MKRIFCGLLVAALAAPGLAGATELDIAPKRQAVDIGVQFDIKVKNGKPKRVRDFVFTNVPVACTEGSYVVEGGPLPKMKVTKKTKKFSDDFSAQGGAQRVGVSGKVIRDGRAVVGKIRVRGAFTDPATGTPVTNCDSGVLPYRAQRS